MTDHTRDVSDQYTSEQVVKQLNAEVAALNAVERAKLAAARHRAVSRLGTRRYGFQAWHGVAATAVLALAVALPLWQNSGELTDPDRVVAAPGEPDTLFGDLPLLATGDDVEFYRDLEFLMWLETQDENAT